MYSLLLTVGLLTQPQMDKAEREVYAAITNVISTHPVDVYIGEENPIMTGGTLRQTRKIGESMWLEFRDGGDAWLVPMSEVKAIRVKKNQPAK
jgi:hypothetical protein